MNGVAKNAHSGRFFESGQMINHDCVLNKELIKDNYMAETELSVLKYEVSTF